MISFLAAFVSSKGRFTDCCRVGAFMESTLKGVIALPLRNLHFDSPPLGYDPARYYPAAEIREISFSFSYQQE